MPAHGHTEANLGHLFHPFITYTTREALAPAYIGGLLIELNFEPVISPSQCLHNFQSYLGNILALSPFQ